MKRIVVVGAPGSGKSTLSRTLGSCLAVPVFERDGLGELGSSGYRTAVADLLDTETWIFDGFPYYVDADVYSAADTVIALDYRRHVVLRRVIKRSLRLARGATDGAHSSAGIRSWFEPDHAVRVAWSKFDDRQAEMRALSTRPELVDTSIIRLTTPSEAAAWSKKVCS